MFHATWNLMVWKHKIPHQLKGEDYIMYTMLYKKPSFCSTLLFCFLLLCVPLFLAPSKLWQLMLLMMHGSDERNLNVQTADASDTYPKTHQIHIRFISMYKKKGWVWFGAKRVKNKYIRSVLFILTWKKSDTWHMGWNLYFVRSFRQIWQNSENYAV